jgi:hypothetical protein
MFDGLIRDDDGWRNPSRMFRGPLDGKYGFIGALLLFGVGMPACDGEYCGMVWYGW